MIDLDLASFLYGVVTTIVAFALGVVLCTAYRLARKRPPGAPYVGFDAPTSLGDDGDLPVQEEGAEPVSGVPLYRAQVSGALGVPIVVQDGSQVAGPIRLGRLLPRIYRPEEWDAPQYCLAPTCGRPDFRAGDPFYEIEVLNALSAEPLLVCVDCASLDEVLVP